MRRPVGTLRPKRSGVSDRLEAFTRVAGVLKVTDPVGLDAVAIHDDWFDLSDIDFDTASSSLTIPYARELIVGEGPHWWSRLPRQHLDQHA